MSDSIIGILYQGKQRYKSISGEIISIFLLMSITAIFIIYFNEFFRQSKPKMLFEDNKFYSPPRLNLSNNFTFFVMTQYEGQNNLNNDLIQIEAIYNIKNQSKLSFQKISPIECIPSQEISLALFKRLELPKGFCFNMSGLYLEGSSSTDHFQSLQIKFSLCLNDTNCLPQNKMIEYFDQTKPVALIYFIDTAFQTYNTSKRVMKFYNSIEVNLTYQNNKETNIFFALNEMIVDENYFFSRTTGNYSEFMINSFQDNNGLRSQNDKAILTVNYLSSNRKLKIDISYVKIQEVLANIFSLVIVLIIFIGEIGNYINYNLFQADLMNSFYSFDSIDNQTSISRLTIGGLKRQYPKKVRVGGRNLINYNSTYIL